MAPRRQATNRSASARGASTQARAGTPAGRPPTATSRVGRNHVSQIQRARMLAAMVDVAAERGLTNATVAHVVARSGVSRRTFYEMFDDREDCFLAALEQAVALASEYVREAYDPRLRWRDRVRAALVAVLEFLEDEPDMGRLCVVETLGAGPRVLERRRTIMDEFIAVVDEGRSEARSGASLPPLTAEGVVGGVLSVLHARLLNRRRRDPLLDLAGPLMGMIVLPYLGPAAAQRDNERRPQARRSRRRPATKDPLRELQMRLTYRTVRVIAAVAGSPGASNREVGEAAGIDDQGQISKLLTRLERLGLIRNSGGGQARGAPNAWTLSERGHEVERAIDRQTGGR
jgi:AcrR family transcriptional regulator/DNA-binding MarR family transcriptional regulator